MEEGLSFQKRCILKIFKNCQNCQMSAWETTVEQSVPMVSHLHLPRGRQSTTRRALYSGLRNTLQLSKSMFERARAVIMPPVETSAQKAERVAAVRTKVAQSLDAKIKAAQEAVYLMPELELLTEFIQLNDDLKDIDGIW